MLINAAAILKQRTAPNISEALNSRDLTRFSANIAVALKYPNVGPALWENKTIVPDEVLHGIVSHLATDAKTTGRYARDSWELGDVLAWHQAVCTAFVWPTHPSSCIYHIKQPVFDDDREPVVWDGATDTRPRMNEVKRLYERMLNMSISYTREMHYNPSYRLFFKHYAYDVLAATNDIAFSSEVKRIAGN